jgi:hypothetical protein
MSTQAVPLPNRQIGARPAASARIMLFDIKAHAPPWPLLLHDLQLSLTRTRIAFGTLSLMKPSFLRRRSISTRIATRILDWVTINVRNHAVGRLPMKRPPDFCATGAIQFRLQL